MQPLYDRDSAKYPDRVFYDGRWRTAEQLARCRERKREREARHGKRSHRRLQKQLQDMTRTRIRL